MKRLFGKQPQQEGAPKEDHSTARPASRNQLKRLNEVVETFYELVSRAVAGQVEFPDFEPSTRGLTDQANGQEVVLTHAGQGSAESFAVAAHEEGGTWVITQETTIPSPLGAFDPSAKRTQVRRFPVSDASRPETVIYDVSDLLGRVEVDRQRDSRPLAAETCDRLVSSLTGVIAARQTIQMRPPAQAA